MTSPTARTLAQLRKAGFICQVVERWCAFSRRRVDLLGCIDVVAVGKHIIGIQCTSASNAAARRTKILTECREAAKAWLEAGGQLYVHGWGKFGKGKVKRWAVRETEITLADLA